MDYERDESRKSLALARSKLAGGDLEGARRFARKAVALFALPEAQSFLAELDSPPAAGKKKPKQKGSPPASKARPKAEQQQQHESAAPTPARAYTDAQAASVKALMVHVRAKNYYAILDVERTSGDMDADVLKKAYRKKALLFHPDKNSAPGADECFKAVGHSFQVLTDPNKKHIYDTAGADAASSSSSAAAAGAHAGFGEGMRYRGGGHPFFNGGGGGEEISPEDLFRAFFGGNSPFGMSSGFGGFGGGGSIFEQQPRRRATARGGPSQGAAGDGGIPRSGWWTLLPILIYLGIFVVSNVLSALFSKGVDPTTSTWDSEGVYAGSDVFQLARTNRYYQKRTASPFAGHKFSYYVHPTTEKDFLRTPVADAWNPIGEPSFLQQRRGGGGADGNEMAYPAQPSYYDARGVPQRWSRRTILDVWINRRYFHHLATECRREEARHQQRRREAQWLFGTADGNAQRLRAADSVPKPACELVTKWARSAS